MLTHGARRFSRAWGWKGVDTLRKAVLSACLSLVVAWVAWQQFAGLRAQDRAAPPGKPAAATAAAPKAPVADEDEGFFFYVLAGGWVGHTIILLSVVAVALAIEHVMSIRGSTLMPSGLADRVRKSLQAGQPAQAEQQCKLQPSVLASVMEAGLSEIEGGWPAIEKAMEDGIAEQSARLFRKIEYISVIGNIAPMLGLLGTVIGMVQAFSKVAHTDGVTKPAELAGGIYVALVTTVEGLIVAIPCLGVFALFRNRVDQLIAEVAYAAQHAFTPLRQARGGTRRPPPGAAVAAPPVVPPPAGGKA